MNHELVRTMSGAWAVRDVVVDEVMHPGVGPRVEAAELYAGQSRVGDRLAAATGRLVLFDVGMGAGSNALAAWEVASRGGPGGARLDIVSFERDLGALELALTQGEDFGWVGAQADVARGILASGGHDAGHTRWILRKGELLPALLAETERADIMFWDPYSPKANPKLWTMESFGAARRVAGPRCTLYTFSASTATRIAMLLGGWCVGVGDSIGKKNQTTAAAVDLADLARPLPVAWLKRVALPGSPWPVDAPPDTVERLAAHPQFRDAL